MTNNIATRGQAAGTVSQMVMSGLWLGHVADRMAPVIPPTPPDAEQAQQQGGMQYQFAGKQPPTTHHVFECDVIIRVVIRDARTYEARVEAAGITRESAVSAPVSLAAVRVQRHRAAVTVAHRIYGFAGADVRIRGAVPITREEIAMMLLADDDL